MSGLVVGCFKQRLAQVGTCLVATRSANTNAAFLASSRWHYCCNSQLSLRQLSTSGKVGSTALVRRGKVENSNPDKEYRELVEDTSRIKLEMERMQSAKAGKTLITVPLHLEERLERKMKKENTKHAIRQRIIHDSRKGVKSQILIHCKRQEFNHYLGQSYDRFKETPLASGKWKHRKSKGDFFTLYPGFKRESSFFMSGGESISFPDLGLNEQLCENLKHLGIERPTNIQVFAIPQLLKTPYNLVAAETGGGKTLAYLLPIIHTLIEEKRYKVRQKPAHPSVVILVPSRELADQVYHVARDLTYKLDINVKLLQGGNLTSKKINAPQKQMVDILVATTNALKVLSAAEVYGIGQVNHIVLDEADTLLDDSFFPDLTGPFLNRFPWHDVQRQLRITLVSATMPKGIQHTIGSFLKVDRLHNCTTPGLHYTLPHVPQKFLRLRKSQKADKIKELVEADMENNIPVLIFCNKSKTCDWLASYLNDQGLDCASVHGRMPMKYRKGRIDMYQNGDINVLVATDLASRGIDTVRTQHVINYEFPLFVADYIHRCGRTGRVGSVKQCQVTNLISRLGEVNTVQKIEESVRKDKPLPDVNANIKRVYGQWYGSYVEIEPIKEDDGKTQTTEAADNDEENSEDEFEDDDDTSKDDEERPVSSTDYR